MANETDDPMLGHEQSERNDEQRPDIEDSKEFKGLLRETQSLRQAKSDLAADQSGTKAEVEALKAKVDELAVVREISASEPSPDDDDLMTAGQVRQLIEAKEREAFIEREKTQKSEMNERFFHSEKQAMLDITAGKYGEGLDFRSVTSLGMANLTEGDRLDVQRSSNPAQTIYDRAIERTPELKALQKKRDQAQFISKLQDGQPPGRSGGDNAYFPELDAGGDDPEMLQILAKPESEILSYLRNHPLDIPQA